MNKSQLIDFIFVHNRRVFPKIYHVLISDPELFQKMEIGSSWKMPGMTKEGIKWQSFVVVSRRSLAWQPRFIKLSANEVKAKKLSKRKQRVWDKYCREHCLNYLSKGEKQDG